jgi:uncharacterized membrane protein
LFRCIPKNPLSIFVTQEDVSMTTRSEVAASLRDRASRVDHERIARGLGWFSLALGAAEVAAPGIISEIAGINGGAKTRNLLRSPVYGLREVAAGVGILSQQTPATWLWARVAGDVLDISSLISALGSPENDSRRVKAALVSVLGVTALDLYCAQQLSQDKRRGMSRGSRSSETIATVWVNKSPEQAYSFWRNFENLPQFMQHLESVESLDENRSRWRANILGRRFEWIAQIDQDLPNELITWRSVAGSDVANAGTVFFEPAPGRRGTIVRAEIRYDAPGGALAAGLAKLLRKLPRQMIEDDLRAFKQVLETGEVIQSDASIHRTMHPAQPPRQRVREREPIYARR